MLVRGEGGVLGGEVLVEEAEGVPGGEGRGEDVGVGGGLGDGGGGGVGGVGRCVGVFWGVFA